MNGYNSEEAREAAGLSPRSCYWKRCSELRAEGLIEDTGEERIGDADQLQMVCEITPYGARLAEQLLRQGWAFFPGTPPAARNDDPRTSQRSAESKPRKTRAESQQAKLLTAFYIEMSERGSKAA
jgi:hypothetical protein